MNHEAPPEQETVRTKVRRPDKYQPALCSYSFLAPIAALNLSRWNLSLSK